MATRNLAQRCDTLIMFAVFILAGINIWGSFTRSAIIPNYLLPYARSYVLQMSIEELVLAGLLIWKAYRLGTCVTTKVATWLFLAVSSISFLFSVTPMCGTELFRISQQILLFGIVLTVLTFIFEQTRFCIRKYD